MSVCTDFHGFGPPAEAALDALFLGTFLTVFTVELETQRSCTCEWQLLNSSFQLMKNERKQLLTAVEANGNVCVFLSRLDQALSQYFGTVREVAQGEELYPETPAAIRKCPRCNNDMVLKTRKNGGSVISTGAERIPMCCFNVDSPGSSVEGKSFTSYAP